MFSEWFLEGFQKPLETSSGVFMVPGKYIEHFSTAVSKMEAFLREPERLN
jgi:hypothetical protein